MRKMVGNVWRVASVVIFILSLAGCSKAAGDKTETAKASVSNDAGIKTVAILVGQQANATEQAAVYNFVANRLADEPNVKVVNNKGEAQYWYLFETYQPNNSALAVSILFLKFGNREFQSTTGLWRRASIEDDLGKNVYDFKKFLREN